MSDEEFPTIHPAVAVALAMVGVTVAALLLLFAPHFGPVPASVGPEQTHVQPPARPLPPAPPMEPSDPLIEPGVTVTFTTSDGSHADTRTDRLIALHVPAGHPPTQFLAPGPFTATWTGWINVDLRDRFQFTFEGEGGFELTVNGEVVLAVAAGEAETNPSKRVRLNKGPNPFTARYTSLSHGGPATARLLWQGSDFPREPIPPMALTHDASAVHLRTAARLRRARELFATGRCFRCHAPDEPVAPELVRDAPALLMAGNRFNAPWVREWVRDPRVFRHDAQMPRLVHDGRDAGDIAAYLATLSIDAEPPAIPDDPATIAQGERLYNDLGCVACHGRESADVGFTLDHLRAKYPPHALRDYLRQPQAHYAWTRMPDFHFTEKEADALAAFLLSQSTLNLEPLDVEPSRVSRGRDLIETVGCLNCHPLPLQNRYASPTFAELRRSDWSRGCVADDERTRGRAPDFSFTEEDRAALLALANGGFDSLTRTVPAEFAAQQVKTLRCNGCHAIDGRPDVWSALAPPPMRNPGSTEPPIDQSRPPLTFAGEKLRHGYVKNLIAGELDNKARPWLHARMGAFPAYAPLLAEGFAAMHGFGAEDSDPVRPDLNLAALGEKLVTKSQGFGCTDCHALGDRPAQNVFEAQGVSLSLTGKRLRHGYYLRWMLHPLRIDPATKMPRYADEGGRTQLSDTLGGNAEKQFGAIRAYLESLTPSAKK